MWGIKEDWFLRFHHCRCRLLETVCSTGRFLLHPGEKIGPCASWQRAYIWRLNLWRWVELFFFVVVFFRGWGWISFYLKQTWLTNGDWPHCGQTLTTCYLGFSCSECCKSAAPLNTADKRKQTLVDFVSFAAWNCLWPNAHKDGKAADRRFPSHIWKFWFELDEPALSTHLGFNGFGWIPLWLMHIFLRSEAFRSSWGDRIDFIIRVNPSTMLGHWIKPETINVFALLRSKY